jgi:hypothetical protein
VREHDMEILPASARKRRVWEIRNTLVARLTVENILVREPLGHKTPNGDADARGLPCEVVRYRTGS